jgi:hypothetical protein
LRRRFNGFDILIAVIVVVGLVLLARRGLHHTGTLATTHPVLFTVTSLPTHNAGAVSTHMQVGGTVTVAVSGSYITFGTLKSVSVVPYQIAVPNGKGGLTVGTDPTQQEVQFTVLGSATLSGKTVDINGNPFLVGQLSVFQAGGAQVSAVITNEQVQ